MTMNAKASPGGKASSLFADVKELHSHLAARDTKTKITIFNPEQAGPQQGEGDSTAIGMVVVINSSTFDEAFKHAEELRTGLGCNCVCSGETEITCTCPDN